MELSALKKPPDAILQHAKKIGCQLYYYDQNFKLSRDIACSIILRSNASMAIKALQLIGIELKEEELRHALNSIPLKGRQQWIDGTPAHLIDVAHNIEAIKCLASIQQLKDFQDIHAVFSMFDDKDNEAAIRMMQPFVNHWYIATIDHPRGTPLEKILAALQFHQISCDCIHITSSLHKAHQEALRNAKKDSLILAFGSFYVVRAVLDNLSSSIPVRKSQSA